MTWRQMALPMLGMLSCGDARTDDGVRAANAAVVAAHASIAPARAADSVLADPATVNNDTVAIRARVDSIAAIARLHPDRVRAYAKVPGQAKLVPVKDSLSWPEAFESAFNLLSDDAGHVVLHVEMPSSESGDWYMESEHVFDAQGRTVFHRAHVSGSGSGCTQILRETVRLFFNPATGARIAQTTEVADKDDRPIADTSKCLRRIGDVPRPKRLLSELHTP